MAETRADRVTSALRGILDAFKSGKVTQAVTEAIIRRAASDTPLPCEKWSLSNRVLTFISGTDDARGYRQWQAVGRQVRKGARAFYILAPRTVKTTDKVTGEASTIVNGFLAVPVFRYEDTEGDTIDRPSYVPENMPRLFGVAEQWGLSVSWAPCNGRYLGWYAHGRKEIVLASQSEMTFWHELAHAAHARVDRDMGKASKELRECAAELAACVLGRLHGVDTQGNAYQYLQAHAGNAYKGAVKVVGLVEKIVEEILSASREEVTVG